MPVRKPTGSVTPKKATPTKPAAKRSTTKRVAAKKIMPAFTKPTDATVEAFETSTTGLPGIERRTMFGYPSVFVNGNMLASIFQDRIMVRLRDTDRATALTEAGAQPFEPMPGRPMREYVELPEAVIRNPALLRHWLERGRAYVAGLPAKKKKR